MWTQLALEARSPPQCLEEEETVGEFVDGPLGDQEPLPPICDA